MQAIYNLSAYLTHYGTTAEVEIRDSIRMPTLMLTGILYITASLPIAGWEPARDWRPLEDSHQDISLAEVTAQFERNLPAAHKRDSYGLARLVMKLSEQHMLSPGLILSVIETESSYRYTVVSKAGAVGMMQLLPGTAAEVAKRYRIKGYHSAQDLADPRLNIKLGAAYLAYLRGRFGNSRHYLAAYNMGPTALFTRLRGGNYELGAIEGYVRKIHDRTYLIREKTAYRAPAMKKALLTDAI